MCKSTNSGVLNNTANTSNKTRHLVCIHCVPIDRDMTVKVIYSYKPGSYSSMSSYFLHPQFMGGHTDIIDHRTQYYEAAELLTILTIEANLRGEFIPLWGTCLGFELLGRHSVLHVANGMEVHWSVWLA